jgi:6-pyruvoyltetrahydropterin/6-carboxytetrahydropterin synthase
MMITVTRRHEICAGHRIHNHEGHCSRLHGHGYIFEFTCVHPKGLDKIGRVIDFSIIKSTLCQWLEDTWDHRMLIYAGDPLASGLSKLDPEGVILLSFIPTAEQMAMHMVNVVGPKLLDDTGVTLVSCTVHETGKCSATFDIPAIQRV